MDFSDRQSPDFDMVITVCDSAASESCPIWPGQPVKAHWSLPDPASVEGSHADRLKAFTKVYLELERRIQHLVNLHPGPIDQVGLKAHLEEIKRRAETMEIAYSAGSHPTGKVNSLAIELLASLDYPTSTLRSKSWMDFSDRQSPDFDMVITVCDSAASESCPIWPGQPVKAHWSLPDPASVEGSHADRLKAFTKVYLELERRIQHLVNLHPGPIDQVGLKAHLEEIKRRAETMEMGNERSV